MTIRVDGVKLTANQFAKAAVHNWGEGAFYWEERCDWADDMTERERDQVRAAIERQVRRVEDFLNTDTIPRLYL